MWLPLIGLILGLVAGFASPVSVPIEYAKYLSVGILAALDSILGGVRSAQEDHFDSLVFLTGFSSNMLMAAFLAYLGDRIGVDLYLAAIVAFGVRLFQNLGIIRRHLIRR